MVFDSIEKNSFAVENTDIYDKFRQLNNGFESSLNKVDGVYKKSDFNIQQTGITRWLNSEANIVSKIPTSVVGDNLSSMYNGVKILDGKSTLGIKEISKWKGNSYSNIKSRAGYSAEVISTTKENLINIANDTGITTVRADDLPKFFNKNDQYVDKVRLDKNGNIIETIQTKFVGKNGKECVDRLLSKKYHKYLEEGKVDKIEIPKDYIVDAKNELASKKAEITQQVEKLKTTDNIKALEKKQSKLKDIDILEEKLEASTVTQKEAMQAAQHPKLYIAKQIAGKAAMDGIAQAGVAAIVTAAFSVTDNVGKAMQGEITPIEAGKSIAIDAGVAGGTGFTLGFISSSVSMAMKSSGNELINKFASVGGGCLPAATAVYAIEIHDSVIDYSTGKIDSLEFADEMAKGITKVTGGFMGGAIGMTVGSVVGPAGSLIGGIGGSSIGGEIGEMGYEGAKEIINIGIELAKGETDINEVVDDIQVNLEKTVKSAAELKESATQLTSNAVNYVITSEAYATAVEVYDGALDASAEELNKLKDKAKGYATAAIDKASDFGGGAAKEVKKAISNFNVKHSLPF